MTTQNRVTILPTIQEKPAIQEQHIFALQAEEIKKLNIELAQCIQAQEQVNTLVDLENQ